MVCALFISHGVMHMMHSFAYLENTYWSKIHLGMLGMTTRLTVGRGLRMFGKKTKRTGSKQLGRQRILIFSSRCHCLSKSYLNNKHHKNNHFNNCYNKHFHFHHFFSISILNLHCDLYFRLTFANKANIFQQSPKAKYLFLKTKHQDSPNSQFF